MLYARGEAEEERLHAAFHAAALAGVPFRVRAFPCVHIYVLKRSRGRVTLTHAHAHRRGR